MVNIEDKNKAELIKTALKLVDKFAKTDYEDEEMINLIDEAKKITKHRLWKLK